MCNLINIPVLGEQRDELFNHFRKQVCEHLFTFQLNIFVSKTRRLWEKPGWVCYTISKVKGSMDEIDKSHITRKKNKLSLECFHRIRI